MSSPTCLYLYSGTFGFRLILLPYLLIMANDPFDDSHYLPSPPTATTPTNLPTPIHQMEDITSASYIPRMARTIPHSTTVHTIFIKKITYPMTSRPDELWILERTDDGQETWRTVETFLENLQLSQDPGALRTTANQWRHYYEVPPISSSSSMPSLFPVLPHLNTQMYILDNRSPSSRIIRTFFNHVGEDPHNIIHKALLHRFIGHHGALHHRLHLQALHVAL